MCESSCARIIHCANHPQALCESCAKKQQLRESSCARIIRRANHPVSQSENGGALVVMDDRNVGQETNCGVISSNYVVGNILIVWRCRSSCMSFSVVDEGTDWFLSLSLGRCIHDICFVNPLRSRFYEGENTQKVLLNLQYKLFGLYMYGSAETDGVMRV